MAFGLKYTLLCTTKKGNLYTAKIYFEGYALAEVNRNIPVNPFRLRKDKAAVVRGTSFEFSIREAVDFEFLEFYTNDSKKVKVELYDPLNNLLWVGYNLPQQYQVPYVPPPVSVTFTASDGLGLLKTEEFTLTGRNSQLDIIRHCVNKIGLGLGFSIAINLFETTHDHTRSALAQTEEDSECFSGLNCYEVLEKILNKYNAEITQSNGRWRITRSADKQSTRMLYSSAGAYEDTEAAPAVLVLGQKGATGVQVYPRNRLNFSLEPGAKKVTLKHDYGRRSSILTNHDFSVFYDSAFPGWNQTGTFTPEQRYNENGPFLFIPGRDEAGSCLSQEVQVESSEGEDFVFSVEVGLIASRLYGGISIPVTLNVQMAVALTDGVNTKFLSKDGENVSWSDSLSMVNTVVASNIAGSPRMNKLELITGPLPFSGTLSVSLYRIQGAAVYQYTYGGVAFGHLNTYFVNGGDLYPSELDTTAEFTGSKEPGVLSDISILCADAPDLTNAAGMYKNVTWLADGSLTTVWHILGSATERTLLKQLAYTLASDMRVARQKLTGELRGDGITFDSIIRHAYNSNRDFEIAEGTWEIYEEIFSVTLLELLTWSDETVTFTDVENYSSSGSGESQQGSGTVISMSASSILELLKEVDGADSGLDADLLDGKEASAFVLTDDARLSDARNAADVYAWAKAATKPSYNKSEVGLDQVDNTADEDKSVAYALNAGAADDSAELGGVPAADYALLANPEFTGTLKIGSLSSNTAGCIVLGDGARETNYCGLYRSSSLPDGEDSYISFEGFNGILFKSSAAELGSNAERMRLTSSGGLHLGGTSDPGDKNFLADGSITGASLKTPNWSFEEDGSNNLIVKYQGTAVGKILVPAAGKSDLLLTGGTGCNQSL